MARSAEKSSFGADTGLGAGGCRHFNANTIDKTTSTHDKKESDLSSLLLTTWLERCTAEEFISGNFQVSFSKKAHYIPTGFILAWMPAESALVT
ncbi:MAG TPA: hypothetical protein VGK24_21240 [Candidatus Angelobacter sp.]|jgi:hypothetical protein